MISFKKIFKRQLQRKVNSVTRDIIGCSPSDISAIINTAKTISEIAEEMPEKKSVSGATEIYLKQIKKDFPDFHHLDAENALKIFISEVLSIQYEGLNSFQNSNVDSNIIKLIEKTEFVQKISDLTFNKIAISGYQKSDEYATIQYQCSVGFNGDNKRFETRYRVEYTLRLSNQNIAISAFICPNCGATIENTSNTICEYCNTKIIRDTILNWIFTSIEEK
jgi:hypothetical protein